MDNQEIINRIISNEHIISAIEQNTDRNISSIKEIFGRLNVLEQKQTLTDERFSNILEAMQEIKNTVKEIKQEVADITLKPAKKWDNISWVVIAGIVGAILTYITTKILY